ncbi:MAG: O-antigen ligase family protein [Candidatus Odinarchaeota archaeon]
MNSIENLRFKIVSGLYVRQVIILLIGLFLPIGSGFTLITGINLSKYVSILVLILGLYTVFFFKINKRYFPIPFLLLTFYMIFHVIIIYGVLKIESVFKIQNDEYILTALFRFFIYIVFSYVLAIHINSLKTLRLFVFFFSIGYIITLIVGFIAPKDILDQGRIAGGFENPNSFAATSLSVLFLNFLLFVFFIKQKQIKLIYLIFFLVSLSGIIFSQSRAVLFGLFMGSLFIFFSNKGLNAKLKALLSISILILIMAIIIPKDIVHDFKKRASMSRRIESKRESRIIIWQSYLNELPKHVLFGKGREQTTSIVAKYNLPPKWQAPHNRYLYIICEFGFLALLFFIYFLYIVYQRIKNSETEHVFLKRVLLAYFICWITMIFFGDYKNSRDYWLFIALMISFGNNFTILSLNKVKEYK